MASVSVFSKETRLIHSKFLFILELDIFFKGKFAQKILTLLLSYLCVTRAADEFSLVKRPEFQYVYNVAISSQINMLSLFV